MAIPDWLDRTLTIEGWITPSGDFLSCDREWRHAVVAGLAIPGSVDAELEAERRGWLRISAEGLGGAAFQCARPLTQAQIDKLWDWCEEIGCDFDRAMKSCEFGAAIRDDNGVPVGSWRVTNE